MNADDLHLVFLTRPAEVRPNGQVLSGARFYLLVPDCQVLPVCKALSDGGYKCHIGATLDDAAHQSYWPDRAAS